MDKKELIIVGVASDSILTERWIQSIREHFEGRVILYLTIGEDYDPIVNSEQIQIIKDRKGLSGYSSSTQRVCSELNIDLRLIYGDKDFWTKSGNNISNSLRAQWKYIKEVADEFPDNLILRTDVFDVIFNGDPRKYSELYCEGCNGVFISQEGCLIKDNSYMIDLYKSRNIDIKHFEHKQVLNSGLILTKGKFLSKLCNFIISSEYDLIDQHLFNLFFYNNLYYKLDHIPNFMECLHFKKDLNLNDVIIIHGNGKSKELVDKYWNNKNPLKEKENIKEINTEKIVVTISTKDRYFSTLPLTIQSIINQTKVPDELYILDDNHEPIDLREVSTYRHLFTQCNNKGINWIIIHGQKRGQVANHQLCLENIDTKYIWRIDDDCVANNNVLETLYNTINLDDKIGAVSCAIIRPDLYTIDCSIASNKIEDIFLGQNIQWYKGKGLIEVDHLYSSFLFKKETASNYKNLSPVGFREETMFTYDMKLAGWNLLVDFNCTIHHYEEDRGGVRSVAKQQFYEHDEKIFLDYLSINKIIPNAHKIFIVEGGIGDHYVFKKVLVESGILNTPTKILLFCCYKEVFEDLNIKLYSIGEARRMYNADNYNIYGWMNAQRWEKPLEEAYKIFYGLQENNY